MEPGQRGLQDNNKSGVWLTLSQGTHAPHSCAGWGFYAFTVNTMRFCKNNVLTHQKKSAKILFLLHAYLWLGHIIVLSKGQSRWVTGLGEDTSNEQSPEFTRFSCEQDTSGKWCKTMTTSSSVVWCWSWWQVEETGMTPTIMHVRKDGTRTHKHTNLQLGGGDDEVTEQKGK